MKKKSKKPSAKALRDQLELSVETPHSDLYGNPEDFVRPLLKEMQTEIIAPDIDLTTKEGALAALEKLNVTSQKLEFYKDRVQKLKGVLTQKRWNTDS